MVVSGGPAAPRNRRASCGGRVENGAAAWPAVGLPAEALAGKLEQLVNGQASPPSGGVSPPSGGHIRVAVRVRPLPENEAGIIEVAGANTVLIQKQASAGGNGFLSSQQERIETRSFDRVFGPQATQREVYTSTCEPILAEAVAAARCATIFAYGATGAGKTHTMFGVPDAEQQGIILRGLPDVFAAVAAYNDKAGSLEPALQVKVSFLEIYNETVRDLLQEGGGTGMCKVLEDERRGIVQVSNLVEPAVTSAEEAFEYLEAGMQARTVESTAANSQSSRAHAVFSLTIERVSQRLDKMSLRSRLVRGSQEQRQLHSKISFVDLAGAERAAFTQNVGQALKDGARINQSLLALANCIDALIVQSRLVNTMATPRRKPPYRDSKLTLMLKGSLMGDGLVAMIANVHPGRLHFEDSNNTLEYAKRASTVKASNRRLSKASFGAIDEVPSAAPSTCESTAAPTNEADDFEDVVQQVELTTASSSASLPQPSTDRARVGTSLSSGTLSTSSLRKPSVRKTRSEQRLLESGAQSQKNIVSQRDEITTASNSDECLSELSLSSGQEVAEEAEAACVTMLSPTLSEGDPEADEDSRKACWVQSAQTPDREQCLLPEQRVAMDMVAKMQNDTQQMDVRLRKVTRERNALLKDRKALEDENERLRAENIEKDRQLLILLNVRPCSP